MEKYRKRNGYLLGSRKKSLTSKHSLVLQLIMSLHRCACRVDIDKSGDITYEELAFAADNGMFGDVASAVSGGLGGTLGSMTSLGGGLMGAINPFASSPYSDEALTMTVPGGDSAAEEQPVGTAAGPAGEPSLPWSLF